MDRSAISEVSFRGGARIGWVNASWPLARLTCTASRLTLTSLGRYEFNADQVVSIEPYGFIPVLARGLRVLHNRLDYPESVIFWCVGSRDGVLEQIKRTGFQAKGRAAIGRAGGFPIRWSVVAAVVVLWNLLFMLGGSLPWAPAPQPGPFALVALLLVLGFATALQRSEPLQRLVLREGHQIGEIKPFLLLIQLIVGFISLVFGAMLLTTM